MYDINTKYVKKGRNFWLIFLIFGLAFMLIFGSVYISSYLKLKSLDASTTSTKVEISSHISDGTTMYSPIYYYEVNGIEYSCSSNSSSSVYPGTDNKTVYYDSKEPLKCMSEYTKNSNKFMLIGVFLPIIFILIGVVGIHKVNKRLKVIKSLNINGKLVKNLPYHMEETGMVVNNKRILKPIVEYTLPSGSVITLEGDARHDKKLSDEDGLVDLLIDENNPSNYFIDFEINRLSGNLPTDYYNANTNNNKEEIL